MSEETIDLTALTRDRGLLGAMAPVREELRACMQCGSCTATCGSAYAMDYTPRQLWELVKLGLVDEILNSKTLWLCSTCYACTLRCPRELPLTETIGTLKRLAIRADIKKHKESRNFYRAFMDTIRRHGRTDEVELMVRYFLTTNPLKAVDYVPLALTMLTKGKVKLGLPKLRGPGKLETLCARVQELEAEL